MKSIDTFYDGHYFRSRLEARWAVFFNALGVEYEYEPEGFILPNNECYLPDFYIPKLDTYIEIKPFKNWEWVNDIGYPSPSWYDECDMYNEDFTKKWFPFSIEKRLLVYFGGPNAESIPLLYGNNGNIKTYNYNIDNPDCDEERVSKMGAYSTPPGYQEETIHEMIYKRHAGEWEAYKATYFMCNHPQEVIPFAYKINEFWGNFYNGEGTWSESEPFKSAIKKAQMARFEHNKK